MAFNPKVLRSESAHVDHADPVGLSGLDRPVQVLRFVDKRILGDRLSTAGVGLADESR